MNNINYSIDLITKIYTKYKIKVEEACFSTGFIPKYIILDKTRNIHSYITFIQIEKSKISGDLFEFSKDFLFPLVEYVKIQYSQLDRPLFFLFLDNSGEIAGIDASDIRMQLLEYGGSDMIHFINKNMINGQQLFTQIKNEL
jgi:hypothetical protein